MIPRFPHGDYDDFEVVDSPLSWREIFYFSIIKGKGHWSIWIGPVLITIDYWGHENMGTRLISFSWLPD